MPNQPDELIETVSSSILGAGIKCEIFSHLGKQNNEDYYKLSLYYTKVSNKYITHHAELKSEEMVRKQFLEKIKDRLPTESQRTL